MRITSRFAMRGREEPGVAGPRRGCCAAPEPVDEHDDDAACRAASPRVVRLAAEAGERACRAPRQAAGRRRRARGSMAGIAPSLAQAGRAPVPRVPAHAPGRDDG